MPVEFLSDDQAARYGHYAGDPTPAQLARYFFLDDADLARIQQHRGSHQRLGFALQLGTVRFLGTFLTDPTVVPPIVVRHLAHQLGITDLTVLPRYLERKATRYTHAREIQQAYGYREFTDQPEHFRLVRWLYLRAWRSCRGPGGALSSSRAARSIGQRTPSACSNNCRRTCAATMCLSLPAIAGAICGPPCCKVPTGRRSAATCAGCSTCPSLRPRPWSACGTS